MTRKFMFKISALYLCITFSPGLQYDTTGFYKKFIHCVFSELITEVTMFQTYIMNVTTISNFYFHFFLKKISISHDIWSIFAIIHFAANVQSYRSVFFYRCTATLCQYFLSKRYIRKCWIKINELYNYKHLK